MPRLDAGCTGKKGETMEKRLFAEQLVTENKTIKSLFMKIGIALLAVLCLLILALIPQLFPFVPVLIVGILVLAYFLIRRMNVEYEYTLTENILTVDRIRAKSTRKRLLSVDVKHFDVFAPLEGDEQLAAKKGSFQTVIDASSGAGAPGRYYAEFSSGGEAGKTLLVFQPNARMIDVLRFSVPWRVMTLREEDKPRGMR